MSDLAEQLEIEAHLNAQETGFAHLQACARQFQVDCQVKTLSYLDTNLGGALVPPPRQARISKLRRNRPVLDTQGWKRLRLKYQEKGSYFAECPRDDEGHCKPSGTASEIKPKKPKQNPVFATVESAGRWLAQKWVMLERRYGRRTALALAIAMIASAPLPGNVAAIITAAEAVRGLHGYFARTKHFLPIEVKGSYLAECPRDQAGHCKPRGESDESGQAREEPTQRRKPQAKPTAKTKPKATEPAKTKIREGFHGVQRQSDGSYAGAEGRSLTEDVQTRVQTMRLPPAWTDVQVAQSADADLQAVGYDAKGREQRVYSAAHWEKADTEKFLRNKALIERLPELEERIRTTLQGPEGPDKEAAAVLLLMRKTGFRIGSEADTKTEHEALGATTLTSANVAIKGDTIRFEFIGKKGVHIHQEIKDKELANMLQHRVQEEGKLFNTSDAKVRDYLHQIDETGALKPKDLRTLVAVETALKEINNLPAPTNEKEYKKSKNLVGDAVAKKLGNTRTVALASYIDPAVFLRWRDLVGIDKAS